jgi:cysteine desulfurase
VRETYLDHASTTPPLPEALAEQARVAAEVFADPSRLYRGARLARMELDRAREAVAAVIGGRPEEIVFTSGGTESCNLAVVGGARAAAAARKPRRIVVSAIEHTAVLEAARGVEGFEVVEVGVDGDGVVDLEALAQALGAGAGLVSIQLANNEVGTLQPVADIARMAKDAGALFHSDACAAVGQIAVDVSPLGVDLLSGSSHKAYGPKGAGFLWVRRGVRVRPTAVGDDRERRRRAGMENLPAIAGMAAALTLRASELAEENLSMLATRLREDLPARVPGLVTHGHAERRLPGIVSFTVEGIEGEALLAALDAKGIAVHSGSSCVASAQEPSHVLAAMGAPTTGSIRVSLGRSSTPEDVEHLLAELPKIVTQVRSMSGVGPQR